MTRIEDPSRQLSYLQQCLSSDKRPLGLFLGAGCPVSVKVKGGASGESPLIPDIAGITRLVREQIASEKDCGPILRTVDEHFATDGRTDTTVEDILSHIRSLRAVAGKGKVRGLSADELDLLDHRICEVIQQAADKTLPSAPTPYHHLASWVHAVHRGDPVEVFTTNYDLLAEQAFEELHVPYFDGFAGARRPFFDLRAMEEDTLPPRWARLWKLHGSINWYQVPGEPNKGVYRGTTKGDGAAKRVIHPSHLKYQESRRMPFLAMIDRLRAFLKKTTAVLILCGYSFRDEHINEVIIQGLEGTQTAIAFALLFGALAGHADAVALARAHPNLTILARDGAVICGQESKWPEKDGGPAATGGSKWVTWAPASKKGKLSAEFGLGDFAVLGRFLEEIAGTAQLSAGGYDAK
jgi:hypothetical protein